MHLWIRAGCFLHLPQQRVPPDHPLRKIRELIREVLSELHPAWGSLRERGTAVDPSGAIAERIAASVFYGIRSERLLIEQLNYNFLLQLVCGAFAGRYGLGSHHLHQEPGATTERRDVCKVHDQASEPSQVKPSGRWGIGYRGSFGQRCCTRRVPRCRTLLD